MPTIDVYREHLYRSDYSLIFLVAAVFVCVLITIRLWRTWPRFRSIAGSAGHVPLGLLIIVINPMIGLLAALSTWPVLFRWSFPRFRPTIRHVLFLALLLRLPVMFQAFWYDEAFTERLTMLSLPQLWPAILSDTHPPLYYTSMWLWSKVFGHSEFMLRLPSLLLGLLAVFLLYRLVRAIGLTERTALIAAGLMAITPSAIYYATEARNYAALTCAVFGALVCIFEDRPKSFIISVALCAWLHNLGLFYVPMLIGAALLYQNPSRRWFSAITVGGLLSLVWLPLTIQQSKSISDGFWIYFNAGTPFWILPFNLMYIPREYILPVMLPYIALLAFGFWMSRRWLRMVSGAALLLVMSGVPLLAIAVSLVWAPVFLPRNFLPITLLALIPLAYALEKHWRIVASVALPVLLTSLILFYGAIHLLKPDYRQMVADGCQGATAMFYTALDTAITIAPEWPGKSIVWDAGTDKGLTFKPDQMPLFDFQDGEISELAGQQVCVVYIFTPRTLQSERDEVARIVSTYPHTSKTYDVDSEQEVQVYIFDVKGKAS